MIKVSQTKVNQGVPLALKMQVRPSQGQVYVCSTEAVSRISLIAAPLQTGQKWGYKPRVAIFGSDSNVINPQTTLEAKRFGKELAELGYPITLNGNLSSLESIIAKASIENGGEVFGVALQEESIVPQGVFTEFEAYVHEYEKQRRLLELGDAFLFLPKMGVNDHSLEEALEQIKDYFSFLEEHNYHSPIYYPALGPKEYYDHIMQNTNSYEMLYEGMLLTVFPGVFPSNRFRSSKALGKVATEVSKGKVVADICSGLGSIGIAAYNGGAKHVVLGDINSRAVENASHNISKLGLDSSRIKVYESDLFKSVPDEYKGKIEVMFFSPPFFKEKFIGGEGKLMHAFLGDGKEGGVIDRFLSTAKEYLAPNGEIYLTFSNKDPEHLEFLEKSLRKYGYRWELKLVKNTGTLADTRIYKVVRGNNVNI